MSYFYLQKYGAHIRVPTFIYVHGRWGSLLSLSSVEGRAKGQ